MKEQESISLYRLGHSARIAVRGGLLIVPLVFFLEATWIFMAAGGFLRHHYYLSVVLLRYLAYGMILGLAIAILSLPLIGRLSPRTIGAVLLGSILGVCFAIEVGLYVLDIVLIGSGPRRMLFIGVVLVLALGITTVTFLVARRLWDRLEKLLSIHSWSKALFVFTAEAVIVLVVFHLSATLAMSLKSNGSPGLDRPNIVLIVLDTVRADALSSSGNLLADTPYLDRLAAEGVRFSRATSASTWTPPGHASLFTGLYPVSHGTRGLKTTLDRGLDVLSSIFSGIGYATVSLYNNPLAGRSNAMDRGFDVAIGVETDTKVSFVDERLYSKYVVGDSGVQKTGDLLYAWAKEYERRGVPWLAFLNLNDAHMPYIPRAPWMDEFLNRLGVEISKVNLQLAWRAMSEEGLRKFRRGGFFLSDAEFTWLRAAYYSEVRAIDHQLGETFERMRRDGLLDNTIIIITADHGEALGEEGKLGHGNLQASVVRIPLIFWAPRQLAPRIDDRWASHVDVLPTLLDLAGVEYIPNGYHFEGNSLFHRDKPDKVVVEDTTADTEGCHSFFLLRGTEGIHLRCNGETILLEVPKDSLTTWMDASQDAARINRLHGDLIGWREACLANHDPDATQSRIEADPRLREQLRALGYTD